uniref:Endonuclease/exonuclease/phosphatase domain-containing protein n=1 Tax=Dicentrarchus labrax TaxID=13489 RepID=A0A8P4KAF7_DICLA
MVICILGKPVPALGLLMSWNVRGLHNMVKKKKVLHFIRSKKCDVVFMRETHLLPQESQNSKSRGVATLINNADEAGRMLLMLCEIQGNSIILANVYAPNRDDPAFFGLLEKKLNDLGDYPIIMGGTSTITPRHL